MTTYTKAQLATRILRDLGVLGADETASSADLDWAKETISSTLAALSIKKINLWNTDEDNIAEEYYILLSHRVGLDVAPGFGLISIAEAEAAKAAVETDLRILAMSEQTGAAQEVEYF